MGEDSQRKLSRWQIKMINGLFGLVDPLVEVRNSQGLCGRRESGQGVGGSCFRMGPAPQLTQQGPYSRVGPSSVVEGRAAE